MTDEPEITELFRPARRKPEGHGNPTPITLWLAPLNAGGPDRRSMLDGYATYIRETDCSIEEHMQAYIIERLLAASPKSVRVNDLWISYFTAWLRPYPDADIGAAAQQLQPIFLRLAPGLPADHVL